MPNDQDAAVHHMMVYGLTGWDWAVWKFLPTQWAASILSRKIATAGRTSFTLPNLTHWRIVRPGVVEPMNKPDLGGAQ